MFLTVAVFRKSVFFKSKVQHSYQKIYWYHSTSLYCFFHDPIKWWKEGRCVAEKIKFILIPFRYIFICFRTPIQILYDYISKVYMIIIFIKHLNLLPLLINGNKPCEQIKFAHMF